MDLLLPLGPLEIARALLFFIAALVLPGRLFLRLEERLGTTRRERHGEDAPLFSGALETLCASVVFSAAICALAFTALTFTVGLAFWTALLAIAAIDGIMGYLVWKERR
jgi:hypothetical protein